MALKDWKKIKQDKWLNEQREIRLEINKGKANEFPYIVSIHSTFIVAGGDKTLKGFNKKSQALKFARAYMKKH